MEAPERKIRLVPCLAISLVGAGIGALGVTGLFLPVTVWILERLPAGDLGTAAKALVYLCPAAVILAILVSLTLGLARSRSRYSKSGRRGKRADWDEFTRDGRKNV